MSIIHKKDCMMLSIAEHPHCTCGAEIEQLKAELDEALVRIEQYKAELEMIDEHLFTPNVYTDGTREFCKEKTPEVKRLLRICDLLDKENKK